jgi:hypothetical protein
MNFAQWYLENGPDPKQQLFPWATEEEPLDYKKLARYKSPENYIKAQTKGARQTEKGAQTVVAAPPNSFMSGKEDVERIFHSEVVIPPKQFANGQVRPERHIAFVLLNKTDPFVNGNKRLIAVWQGEPNNRVTKNDILSHMYDVLGGIVFKGSYLTHAWIDPNYKGPDVNLYRDLREFARKYYGVIGTEPGDELTSKSYRTTQAKYDWKRFQQWQQQPQEL